MSHTDLSRRAVLGLGLAAPLMPRFALAAEPQANTSVPAVAVTRTTQFGEYTITTVQDAAMRMSVEQSPFAAKTKPEELRKILAANKLRTDQVGLDVNVLIMQKGKDVLLIDGGTGQKLMPALAQLGIKPEMVGAIALTHAHGDHYNGLLKDGKSAFPNATIFVPEAEYAFWTAAQPEMPKSMMDVNDRRGVIAGAQSCFNILKPQIRTIAGDKEWGTGIAFMPMPGHTPGHAGVRISSGKETMIHWADLCHHAAIIVQNPNIQVKFDTDPVASADMRRKMFDQFAKEGYRIMGSHMPFPGFGRILKSGKSFRWEIEPWVQ
ncbi:MAG: MBL fold metallo-hydrolase [Chthonomonas sp.]|nr:MBL fold metallo-hydrolase [Chthonomonas sp.]